MTGERPALEDLLGAPFAFAAAPSPVPADLRAEWRVALLLLIADAYPARSIPLARLHAAAHAAIHLERIPPAVLDPGAPPADPAIVGGGWSPISDPATDRAAARAAAAGFVAWNAGGWRITGIGRGEARQVRQSGAMAAEIAMIALAASAAPGR